MPGKAFTSRAPGEDSLGSIAEGTTRGGAAGDHFGAVYGHEFAESIEHPAQRAAFDPSSLENASAGDPESWAVYWTQQAEVTAARAAPTGRQGATASQKGSRAASSTFPPKSGEGVDGGAAFMFLSLLEFCINSLGKKNAAPSSSSPVGIAKKTPTPPPTPGRKRPWRATCPLPPCLWRRANCRPRSFADLGSDVAGFFCNPRGLLVAVDPAPTGLRGPLLFGASVGRAAFLAGSGPPHRPVWAVEFRARSRERRTQSWGVRAGRGCPCSAWSSVQYSAHAAADAEGEVGGMALYWKFRKEICTQ